MKVRFESIRNNIGPIVGKPSGDVATQSSGLGLKHARPLLPIYVGLLLLTKQLVGSLLQLFFFIHDVVNILIKYRDDCFL